MIRTRQIVMDIAAVNFIAFGCTVAVLGGEPAQGKIVSGHFFLGYHHRYVEVSSGTYWAMVAYMVVTFALLGSVAVYDFFATRTETRRP